MPAAAPGCPLKRAFLPLCAALCKTGRFWGVNEIKHRKTTERFREDLRRVNPDLDLLGEYLGAKTKVAVKSRECGHTWEALPTNLLRGFGCPFCSGMLPIPGETDLATVNPELAAQWHPTKNGDLTPADVKAGSTNRVWWITRLTWTSRI